MQRPCSALVRVALCRLVGWGSDAARPVLATSCWLLTAQLLAAGHWFLTIIGHLARCGAFAQFRRDGIRLGTMSAEAHSYGGGSASPGTKAHSTIVRSHVPGGCPLPPMPRACNYSIPSRRPYWCSDKTDARARYMTSGKRGQRFVCTYFELRQLPILPRLPGSPATGRLLGCMSSALSILTTGPPLTSRSRARS